MVVMAVLEEQLKALEPPEALMVVVVPEVTEPVLIQEREEQVQEVML